MNAAENKRPQLSVEETIAGIDDVMAEDVEGWTNGSTTSGREADRQAERFLFDLLPDYQRTFDRVIIEPPLACVAWTMSGSVEGNRIVAQGCTNFEVTSGRILRYWLYLDPTPFTQAAS
jgi:hypothetical protein